MSLITIVGISLYMIGHGVRGLPNLSVAGSALMIVGGVLVLVGALV